MYYSVNYGFDNTTRCLSTCFCKTQKLYLIEVEIQVGVAMCEIVEETWAHDSGERPSAANIVERLDSELNALPPEPNVWRHKVITLPTITVWTLVLVRRGLV